MSPLQDARYWGDLSMWKSRKHEEGPPALDFHCRDVSGDPRDTGGCSTPTLQLSLAFPAVFHAFSLVSSFNVYYYISQMASMSDTRRFEYRRSSS